MIQIGPDIRAWTAPGGGWGESNAGLITGHKASLLVDTLWDLPRTAAMLSGFRKTLETAPIARVVNTHADGDHWFGNQLTGASEIIATQAAARSMRRHGPHEMDALRALSRIFRLMGANQRTAADYFEGMMRPFDFSRIRPVRPTATFSGKMQLDVGGRRVELIEVGPAHTSGDLVVYLPEERVLFAGDILFHGVVPVLWDGSPGNWIRTGERILSWKVELVVPGHGKVTDLAALDAMRSYWQFLEDAARRHFENGDTEESAAAGILRSDAYRARDFANWLGQERIMINVHAIYRGLKGRRGGMGVIERLRVLGKTALLAREFAPAGLRTFTMPG